MSDSVSMDTLRDILSRSKDDAFSALEDLVKPKVKTLAEMTSDEREKCVGMWCDVVWPDGDEFRSIISRVDYVPFRGSTRVLLAIPDMSNGGKGRDLASYEMVTPLFEFAPAWVPGEGPKPKADTMVGRSFAMLNEIVDDMKDIPVGTIIRDCDGDTDEWNGERWSNTAIWSPRFDVSNDFCDKWTIERWGK